MPVLNVPPVPDINVVQCANGYATKSANSRILKDVNVNSNFGGGFNIAMPTLGLKLVSPFKVDFPAAGADENMNALGVTRSRASSNASRKSAKRRAAGKAVAKPSTDLKENSVQSSAAAGLLR
jgi:hypothetical protein